MRIITFQKVLQESEQAQATLGERVVTEDGREWTYVRANEAVLKGHVVTRTANTDVDTVYTSQNAASQNVFITEASAGWTVGAYQNGYGLVDDGTGEGQFFKIKDNSADTLEVYEDYALSTALTVAAADDIVIVQPFLAEKVAITTKNQICIGVAQVLFTTQYYGWVLSRGIGQVLPGATLTANSLCGPGDDAEGEVETYGNGSTVEDESIVGRVLVANTTDDKMAMIEVVLV